MFEQTTAAGASRRRLYIALLVFFLVFCLGVIGFRVLGGARWSVLDSVYMTVITLSTVGYGEVQSMAGNPAIRVFAILFNLVCLGTIAFAITAITAFIVEGELKNILWRRRMDKQIARLKDHYIVCGSDETAQSIVRELLLTRRKFVVIEPAQDKIDKLAALGRVLVVQGDASEDETLVRAGIARAKGIFLSLPTDEGNLFVTISARGLNPKLRIVAKGIELGADKKISKAGADIVISPSFIGGMRMVSEMVRPAATTFLDMMLRDREKAFRVDEVTLERGAPLVGKTVAEARIGEKTGALLVAVRKGGGADYEFNPPGNRRLEEGDVMILIVRPQMRADVGRIARRD